MTRPGANVGRHELVALIGEGSMGMVWEAVLHGPHGFDKRVALKLLRLSPTDYLRDALIREARIGAMSHHPNVVGTYELGVADGVWFVSMELVRGPTVAQLLREPLSPAIVIEIGLQTATGLRHLHGLRVGDAPVVHRDVKPSNLLVDRSGLVKVADLGMATAAGGTSSVGGSPPYLSPEQAGGRQDPRSDVWSLGVVLYELATGTRPFGSDVGAIGRARRVEDRWSEASFGGALDEAVPGLAQVVRGCLRLDPADRFEHMGEVAAALGQLTPRGETLVERLARTEHGIGAFEPVSRSPRAVATVSVPTGNLPSVRDRFHGRTRETAELGDLLRTERMVTIVGFGGLGKTRTALEAARAAAGAFSGGVWWVPLAECVSEIDVQGVAAKVFGVPPDRTDVSAALGDALRALGRAVVVLDNVEQVRGPVARGIAGWLDEVPAVTWLCTSRVPVGVRGERAYALGPLDPRAAVALFVDRAAVPLPPEHEAEVAELVAALDGHPLAIELAAARTRVLPVPRIVSRLGDRLRLLSGGSDAYPERHRSLAACVAWSWELLPEARRAALAQLSVFDGGFSLEAAEGVLALDGDPWAIEVLTELVDTSLVRVDPKTGRFSMVPLVWDFVVGRLDPEARAAAERRHGQWYGAVAPRWTFRELAADLENVEVAIRRAVARGDGGLAATLVITATRVYDRQGPYLRARELLEQVSAVAVGAEARAVGRLLGRMCVATGEVERGIGLLEAVVDAAATAEDVPAEVAAWSALGTARLGQGEPAAAQQALEAGLSRLGSEPDGNLRGQLLVNLGTVLQARGRTVEAREAYERAVELVQRAGNGRSLANAQANLGALAMDHGEPERAERLLLDALRWSVAEGERRLEGVVRGNLGQVRVALGRIGQGVADLTAALELHRRVGNRRSEAYVLANLGNAALRAGDTAGAQGTHEQALALAEQLGLRALVGGVLRELARDRLHAGDVDGARERIEAAERVLRGVGARYELARTLCLRARLFAGDGGAEAREIARQLGVRTGSELAHDLAELDQG